MKRIIVIGVIVGFLAGCAPTITIKPDGTMIARNYAVVQAKDGRKSYIPKPWWQVGFVDSLVKLIGEVLK